MVAAFRLSRAGYGTPREIMKEPLDLVIGMIIYENWLQQYEEEFIELNKET
jgi:hypothetical protein